MLTPVHNPALGRLRVIGYASGSGDTLWKALEMQKEMEAKGAECPFEVVGVFSSKKESKAKATAQGLGIPYFEIDIAEYYEQRGKPLKDREVRKEYDAQAASLFRHLKADAILLAGYVWATTDCLLDEYLLINVHPADLSVVKEGKRPYAGGNGVGDALKAREPSVCSSSHLATKEIDGGPLLILSEHIPVDYNLHADDQERVKHYLKLVNEQSRMVGARTLFEVSMGNFQTDDNGSVYYKGKPAPHGIRFENWGQNIPVFQRKTEKLLSPDSVAVIGASGKPGTGRSIIENIMKDGYTGKVYAVNTKGEDVAGAKGYKSVAEIEGPVDMAVIATPGAAVLEVTEALGQKGVSAVVCISAGFKEIGGEGIAAQEKLVEIVDKYNMRMLGPNCMGLMSLKANLNATILHGNFAKGSVALMTQSGAIGAAMLDYADEFGIGFSSIISLGNQADVTACELLPYFDMDEHTCVIVMYLETILDPQRFWRVASLVKKPILLLKAGATAAGMSAASSHTGSLAGDDKIVDALIKKSGITRVESLQELFLCAVALSNMPPVKGNRVGLLTNAGGPGIVICDALSDKGFVLPHPSDKLAQYLAANLMREASVHNPIDIVAPAPPEHYELAARAMLESGEYDALLICCVPPATVDTAKVANAMLPAIKAAKIPVVSCFFGPTLGGGARKILTENHIPTTVFPEQLAHVLAGMRKARSLAGKSGSFLRAGGSAVNQGKALLGQTAAGQYIGADGAYKLLDLFGIKAAKSLLLKSPQDAAASGLSFPVVAKIEHPEIVHKSDVGGVRLNIASDKELAEVCDSFLKKFPGALGVLAQEQMPQGLELIAGGIADPQLGSSVMVGLGGVWVEVMKDVVFGYPPLSNEEALNMIASLRCEPLLAGFRGREGVSREALADLLEKISALLLALPDVAEIDLNPIVYTPSFGTFIALDVRIKKA